VEGLQSAGVGACVKHFPGHGDTSVDSHRGVPVVGTDPRDGALRPFESAIAAGARAVMSGHVVAPALDSVVATASRAVMTDLLRGAARFTGMALSDGLEMNALSVPDGIEQGAVRAMAAGCDLLCVGGGLADEETVVRLATALVDAVPPLRLTEAASRVDEFASWRARQPPALDMADRAAGLEAARRAIRADGDVRVLEDVTVIRLDAEPSIAAGVIPWGVEDALRDRGVRVHGRGLGDDHSLVITVRDLHRHASQANEVARLLARRPDAVVVEMGAPYCRPSGARNYIATMGAARVCAEAAAEVLRP
jgi:beta-N-acetylhexosaminidase